MILCLPLFLGSCAKRFGAGPDLGDSVPCKSVMDEKTYTYREVTELFARASENAGISTAMEAFSTGPAAGQYPSQAALGSTFIKFIGYNIGYVKLDNETGEVCVIDGADYDRVEAEMQVKPVTVHP